MPETLQERARRWSTELGDGDITRQIKYTELLKRIDYIAAKRYEEFQPAKNSGHPDFWLRLTRWIDNVGGDEADQKVLLRLVPELFFIGLEEFDALFKSAYNGPIRRWLIDQCNISLEESVSGDSLAHATASTWFCSITDINLGAFYRLNSITEAHGIRTDINSHAVTRNREGLRNFIQERGIKRLVLLEDFVGTGTQMKKPIEFAATISSEPIPILVVPLVIGRIGLKACSDLSAKYPHVQFAPVLPLDDSTFVFEYPQSSENELWPLVRDIVERMHNQICGNGIRVGKYGFKAGKGHEQKAGATVILYSNCPNNTLPLIYHSSDTWEALFPRSPRR
ncbi:MAG TPA: hypothetical protein VF681_04785 [Abditibacteriaceae bacterium]|jgi:hypothetical protein